MIAFPTSNRSQCGCHENVLATQHIVRLAPMSDPIPEQLDKLRKTTSPQHLWRAKVGCLAMTVAIVAGFMVVGYLLSERDFFFMALILGVIGLGTLREFSKERTPHLARARQALNCFEGVAGTVRIVVETDDGSHVYRAAVPDRAGKTWVFPFSPEGWIPETGDYPAELRFVEGVEWPTLVVTDAGILYTVTHPKQERLVLPGEEAEGSTLPKGRILLGVVLMVAGVGWSSIMWNMYRLDARIMESGVAVEAEVVKVGHLRTKRDEDDGLVYRFALPDGRQFERTWSVDDGRWKAYRVGDRIPVWYHPDDPERHIVEGRKGTSLDMALLFIALSSLPFFGFGVALVVSGLRKLRETAFP